MARKSNAAKDKKFDKEVSSLDKVAQKLLSFIDDTYDEKLILSAKNAKMQEIINNELNFSKGVSNGSIIDFVVTVSKNTNTGLGREIETDPNELFTQDIGNLFGYFQEMYKNKYIELADLKFITKFIPAIGEAVSVTLDSIVGADDMSTTITRVIELGDSLTEEEKQSIMYEINKIEKNEKLLKKLKNVVYKKALVGGNYYVYAVPYAELFTEYQRLLDTGKINKNPLASNDPTKGKGDKGFNLNKPAKESYGMDDYDFSGAFESATLGTEALYESISANNMFDKEDLKDIKKALKGANFSQYEVSDSEFLIDALEGIASVQSMKQNMDRYITKFGGSEVKPDDFNFVGDGTYDVAKTRKKSTTKFDTKGTYLKYIDANHMLPIKVFNRIVGYFHIHDTTISRKDINHQASSQTNLLAISSNLFNSTNLAERKREAAMRSIVDTISDGILNKFSRKFVNKNADFKNIIADCIIANGMVNNNFQIQFIPAKYVIPFVINEDEEGRGESMLQNSLFPAKMLLSLVVNKLLTYMNKGGSKTIAHIKKGPIGTSTSNHVNRVVRMLQESQITFSDLLSTNLTFSKFARDGNIALPTAKDGSNLVEFETQEGQQVDLKPEMEQWLENLAIMGTSVPSVILEYTNAADYAKSIVTANIKFASRVACYQADFEEATTELYKVLLYNSNLEPHLKEKAIATLQYKLPRPRVLSNQNISEYLNTIQQSADMQTQIMFGNNSDGENKNEPKARDAFLRRTVMENSPFIDWEAATERLKDSWLEVIEKAEFADDTASSAGIDLTPSEGDTPDADGGGDFQF